MSIIAYLSATVVDALFPLSKVEEELLAMTPEEAYSKLPKSRPPPLPEADSVFAYGDERVATLVWQIKYMKSNKAILIGAYALRKKLHELFSDQPVVLVPIPITKQRRRERGFNQCELLIEAIKKFDEAGRLTTCNDLLIRTRHKDRQTLKNRAERLESAQGIFSINEKAAAGIPRDSIIIVIDDVITTGSTMMNAMETAKKLGTKVRGLSLAH